jgi:hypothetical protein
MKFRWIIRQSRLSLVIAASMALTVAVAAQVKSKTTASESAPTKEVTVERAEVVNVAGNDLIVKMEDGQIRHFPNIPETARATVDGKELGIHDLKPGMKLERTITTTTTPRTVTTVESVTGKVWHASPPTKVVLTLENGENQEFTIPSGQKFTVDGQETDAWGLKKGMTVTATRITEVPETVVQREQQLAGTMPPPPSAPPAGVPVLIAIVVPATRAPSTVAQNNPAPAAPAETEKALPQTATWLPNVGAVGMLLLLSGSLLWRRTRHEL